MLLIDGRPPRVDQLAPRLRIGLGEQGGQRCGAEGRVGHIPARIGKGEAHGLDGQVQAFRREGVERSQVVPFEDIEGQQRGQSLPVGRTLPDAQAAIRGADGLLPRARVRSQVLHGHAAARGLEYCGDGLRNRALVIGALAALRDGVQRAGQARVAEEFARTRPAAVQRQLQPARRGAQLPLRAPLPEVRRERRDRKPFLRQPDGRRKDAGEGQAPVPLDQVTPARTGAGHGDGVRVVRRQLVIETFCRQPFERQARGRAARPIERADVAGLYIVEEREAVAADAGGGRLGDVERGRGGDRRIRRVAACGQHLQSGCHGERLRRRNHAATPVDRRTAGDELRQWVRHIHSER